MALLLVSYDLNKEKNYPKLWDALKNFDSWARPVESVWIIKTDLTQAQLRDYLMQFIDKDDQLIVVKLSGSITWFNLGQKVVNWLMANPA